MNSNKNTVSTHINLSDSADRLKDLEAFFEQHSKWFHGDTIVIAEGPPVSSDEKQVLAEPAFRLLIENSTYHYVRKHLFFAPSYAFCFSEWLQKSRILAYAWFLFDLLKIITVGKCSMQEFEKLSLVFSLDEDPAFDTTKYVTICLKGEFDSDMHLRSF